MQTKIHKTEIKNEVNYWFIYQGGGKCQLLLVQIDEENKDGYQGKFVVILNENGETYTAFPIEIDNDEDGFIEGLFTFEDKGNAEIMWSHYFIKDFLSNTSVEYHRFLELTQKLHEEHPELLLKGL